MIHQVCGGLLKRLKLRAAKCLTRLKGPLNKFCDRIFLGKKKISRSAGLELVPKRAPRVVAVNIIVGIGMQASDQKHDSSGQLSGR